MRISPAVTLGLSVAFGVAAIFTARHFVAGGAENEAEADPIDIVEIAKPQLVPVVISTADIARGDVVDGLNLIVEDWPADQAPYGRFESVAAVGSNEYSARLAMTNIAAGEPVLDSRLSPAGMRPSLAGRLEPGFRAYTISMNDIAGVAGFVLPGDHVDILHTKDSNASSKTKNFVSVVLLTDIEVLGVGLNDDIRTDQPAEFHNATLAVSLEDARKLSAAGQDGVLSLALRGTRDKDVASVVTAAAKPVQPRRRPRSIIRPVKKPEFGTVQVVLGETKQDFTVPANVQP